MVKLPYCENGGKQQTLHQTTVTNVHMVK